MEDVQLRYSIAVAALVGVIAVGSLFHPFGIVKTHRSLTPLLGASTFKAQTARIIKKSCQDCHSDGTVWPWYSYVAPISWMIEADVQRGRSHMNFTHWAEYSSDEQQEHLAKLSILVQQGDAAYSISLSPSRRTANRRRGVIPAAVGTA
jgi:hypothetical protein